MLDRLRLRLKFLAFVRHPTRTNLIFEIVDIATRLPENQGAITLVENRVLADDSFRQLWEERWRPPFKPLPELAALPGDSFGYAYFTHLTRNKLAQEFYKSPSLNRPIDYVSFLLYRTHDLWHVLLGYDVSPAGELGVQAFTLAQLQTPISSLLIAGGMLNILRNCPEQSTSIFESLVLAYERGLESSFLLGFRLEQMLDEPLELVRRHVNLAA
jgi:ubiquinone biosynthesis protein COQ4